MSLDMRAPAPGQTPAAHSASALTLASAEAGPSSLAAADDVTMDHAAPHAGAPGSDPVDLDAVDPARLASALGLRSAPLVAATLGIPALRPLIALRLETVLAEAEAAAPKTNVSSDGAVAAFLQTATLADIEAAARVAATLAHVPTLLSTTDGRVLAQALTFADCPGVAAALRAADAPALAEPPTPETLTADGLAALAAKLFGALLAMTPPARRLRLALVAPTDVASDPALDPGEVLGDTDDDAVWRVLIARAIACLEAGTREKEHAGATH